MYIAEDVTVYNHTVEEGKSMQFECDLNTTSPFYYHKFIPKNINPQIYLADTSDQWPWAVYAINVSNSPANLRVIPSFLAKSEQPLNIPNISVDFNNALVCCQGYQSGKWLANDQNITSLSVMTCYRVDVHCKRLHARINAHDAYIANIIIQTPCTCMYLDAILSGYSSKS